MPSAKAWQDDWQEFFSGFLGIAFFKGQGKK